jgi:hypothetical protein
MEDRYGNPQQLVEGLQLRQPGARARLWQLLREPVGRLMAELIRRHGIDEDGELLTAHALHAAETGLRARGSKALAGLGWNAFRATTLLQIARTATAPHGATASAGPQGPPPLPDAPSYQSDAFYRPSTRVGEHFFGGDWYAGRSYEGSLWVFVADVTGHGYFAYLLATALPAVWQHCWELHPGRSPQPAELLAFMHRQLSDSLPEGIFLECTLARLGPDGEAVVSPAGGTRLLVRRGQRPPELVKLRGAWLGLAAPSTDDQYHLRLGPGDELILATDGAFDQLEDHGGIDSFARKASGASLFDAFRDRLEESLQHGPQKDDVTLVMVRRREASPVVLKFPCQRADDVRV